jgi:hypothetical protein
MSSLFRDKHFTSSISQIELRAEHQQDGDHLLETFVDPGIAVQLQNDNSQILYGRRGTGKTHLLKVIERELDELKGSGRLAVYIDMRNLGSSSIFEDENRSHSVRVSGLLRDVLEAIHSGLLAHMTDPEVAADNSAYKALEDFGKAMVRTVLREATATDKQSAGVSRGRGSKIDVSISPSSPGLSLHSDTSESKLTEKTRSTSGQVVDKLFFHELSKTLEDLLDAAGIQHLTILFDEWSQVPYSLQPLLAEFIRRAILGVPKVAVKIASLEYRSNFRERRDANNNVVGFEMGADISAALELDEYYIYYGNRSKVPELFAKMLCTHISTEVDRQTQSRGFLKSQYGIADWKSFVDQVFTTEKAFHELVRAGQGIVRDYMNIFARAYFAATRAGAETIDARLVRQAAAEWYELDKTPNIDQPEEEALKLIAEKVIARNGTVTFMLSRHQEHSPLIRAMVDLRLMHLLERGIRPDKENPGERYNVYALDYGIYVHLMGTSRAPRFVLPAMHGRKEIIIDELVKRLDGAAIASPV